MTKSLGEVDDELFATTCAKCLTNRPLSAPPLASDSIKSPTTALPARRDGLERERDGPPPLSLSSNRVVLIAPEGGPGMDQDYRPPDDERTAGGVGCVGVGFEDVRVDRAPRGGWDGM
jgi:hypothetical protein